MRELRRIAGLAVPVILAELGWMFMGVVDTIMVGPLGPSAIGAVSIGNALWDVPGIFGIGLLLGLDTVVSQAFGAARQRECDRWLWQGVYLAVAAAPLLILAVLASIPLLDILGVHSGVRSLAVPYMYTLNWSLPPLLIYAAVRRYLQAINRVKPVMFALLSANVFNALGNWILIPRLGVEGAGWATCAARLYMAGVLASYALVREPRLLQEIPRPNWASIRSLLSLGTPAAGQILLEVGVFAMATMLAGRLRPEALAAHQVVLNIAGTTFMVPLGISSAGAVVVGQAIGRGDIRGARHAGWVAIGLGAGVMAVSAAVLVIGSEAILRVFTRNTDVLEIAVPLLFIATVFQIADGTQVSATGVLRGAGDTRTPMLANLMGHWVLALPAGYVLCFREGHGVWGLWSGLCIGLIAVAALLLLVWSRKRL